MPSRSSARCRCRAIDTALVLKVLEPIWTRETRDGEPAARADRDHSRLREGARLSRGENPARWRGHLDKLLPARRKVRQGRAPRRPALRRGAGLHGGLAEQAGVAARALEFAILTAARTGEVIGARWSEIDLLEKTLDGAGRAHEGRQGAPCTAEPRGRSPSWRDATRDRMATPMTPLCFPAASPASPCPTWPS